MMKDVNSLLMSVYMLINYLKPDQEGSFSLSTEFFFFPISVVWNLKSGAFTECKMASVQEINVRKE